MIKYVILFLLLFQFSSFAVENFKPFEFRDLKKNSNHWSTASVYELVRLGVTRGYPDGTFRGKKYIDRYEMASFLSKLSRNIAPDSARQNKLLSELAWELERVKYDLAAYKKESIVSGGVEARLRTYHLALGSGSRGPDADYRVNYSYQRNFGGQNLFRMNFDTNDAGFNTAATREVALTMFDLLGQFEYGDVIWQAVLGPGSSTYTSSEVEAYEGDNPFLRPKTSISAKRKVYGLNTKLAMVAHQVDTNGFVNLNEIQLGFNWGAKLPLIKKTNMDFTLHYLYADMFSDNSAEYNLIGRFNSVFKITDKLIKTFELGLGTTGDFPHGAYVGGDVML